MGTISIEMGAVEVAQASEWKSLRIREALGEPDTLSVDVLAFMRGDALMTAAAVTLFSFDDNFLNCVVRRQPSGEILFSGLNRLRAGEKPAMGAIKWAVTGTSWGFLAPKRLVGRPDGSVFEIQEDDDADRLPTAVAIDPAAGKSPTAANIQQMFESYWNFPVIDTDTFVFDILPVGADAEELLFSGTDIEGAMNDLMAAGNAAALWWFANDSPDPQSATAPNFALHVAVIPMPDEGDDGDDLLAGFPSADAPVLVAPFFIDNDNPDAEGDPPSIMATKTAFQVDLGERDDAVYVRGATGFTQPIIESPPGWPFPYVISSPVIQGGSGWVGSPGGIWGERYVDAPAAISPDQRDAIGQAHLAHVNIPQWTGSIHVVGYDGWHKGQALRITDQDWGFDGRWFLIRAVELIQHDPLAEATEYVLTVGDTMGARLGYELRQQRLAEQRKEIAPATKFVMYVGDLLLAPGETAAVTAQLASDAGKAMPVKGVNAQWFLLVNGVNQTDPEDTGADWFLTNVVTETDVAGQITATLNAGAGATADDAAAPFAKMVGAA